MQIPKIGDTITPEKGLELALYYDLHEVARRIGDNPNAFKDWCFDGGSMVPDELMADVLNIDEDELIEAFLLHDLPFAYGRPGDTKGKHIADCTLELRLLHIGVPSEVAKAIRAAVDLFGNIPGSSFRWNFAEI